jgi:hypothetical protein
VFNYRIFVGQSRNLRDCSGAIYRTKKIMFDKSNRYPAKNLCSGAISTRGGLPTSGGRLWRKSDRYKNTLMAEIPALHDSVNSYDFRIKWQK